MDVFLNNLMGVITTIRIVDILDILAVAILIYYTIRLVRETRAVQLIKSIGAVFVVYFIANTLDMVTLTFFVKTILDIGLIVLVVLFQPELRRALERIGRSRLVDLGRIGFSSYHSVEQVEELISILRKSTAEIIRKGDGALIVLERETMLGEVVNTGVVVDAKASVELLGNIFFTNAPLHDGAVVIREGRVVAAGCYLPLSETDELGRDLGTRHRAAVGVSEVSDALVIVVSEERGTISLAENGVLKRDMTPKELEAELKKRMLDPLTVEKKSRWSFGGGKHEKK